MREHVIKVRNERDQNKKEELISSYAFDVMYAVQDGSIDSVYLKSQGFAINICVDLALEIMERLNRQSIPVKMKIHLNSRFPNQSYKGKSRQSHEDRKNPQILSFLDIKLFLTKK